MAVQQGQGGGHPGFTKYGFEMLTSVNYLEWKERMYYLLQERELWEIVEAPKPQVVDAVWTRANAKAIGVLGMCINSDQMVHVSGLNC